MMGCFWSPAWQELERQADEEIDNGDVTTFDDPRQALQWLAQPDGELAD